MSSCYEFDEKDFSRKCRRSLFQYVMEREGVDNKEVHLRAIWTKTCKFLFDDAPSRWQLFAAIITDKEGGKCHVKFVKYVANLAHYDSEKPLGDQLKIERQEPVLDLYSSPGKEMGIQGLMNLAAELKAKYSNVSSYRSD